MSSSAACNPGDVGAALDTNSSGRGDSSLTTADCKADVSTGGGVAGVAGPRRACSGFPAPNPFEYQPGCLCAAYSGSRRFRGVPACPSFFGTGDSETSANGNVD